MELAKKVIWITGASSGLGEAMAVEAARQKARLVLSARRESELNRVKQECIRHIREEDVLILPVDVGALQSADKETARVIEKFGRIDVLINNAGIAQRSFGGDTPIDVERKIMEVNYFGTIILTKSVLAQMRKQKSGNIAVISSIMGKLGFPGRTSYASSKHALHGYFESMRIEEKNNGIHFHIICPGYIKTNVSLNAVNAAGDLHKKMDQGQARGMDPVRAAQKVLSAIRNNRFETFFGGAEVLTITLKRYCPRVFYWLMMKFAKPRF